jgi:CheY-like chemotaxis protein
MDVDSRFSPERLRVLAVDDDPTCLLVLKTQLKFCNYNDGECMSVCIFYISTLIPL